MQRHWFGWVVGFGLLAGSGVAAAAAPAGRPNIVVILSDDMGYSDIGCYGSEIPTPNLDALAGNGVRFARFYNNARCCPTRASLLTGLYPHQAGIGHMMEDRGFDGYRGVLNRQSVTIAEVLRPSGYGTYMTGKWHVSRFMKGKSDPTTWPVGRGFDRFYGTLDGAGSFYDPAGLTRGSTAITVANDPEYQPESFYYTDAIAANAVRFLQQHQTETPTKPFFLYAAFTAAHWPMHAPAETIAHYAGKYDSGYAPIRQARLAKMKAQGLVDPALELSVQAGDWDKVANKAWEARCQEVYAAMVERLDTGVGRIVAQLKASGQFENTMILFLQDNGGCAETTGRIANAADPGNLKPMAADTLQTRIQPPMQTRDGRWVKTGPGVMPGPADTYIAYGRNWANVSNTPFREYKHWTHEGGIATPLIAHWPAEIKSDRVGAIEPQAGHLIDIMATCVDISGASYPTEVAGQTIKPRQGVSLRPAFNGEDMHRGRPLFWEHESNRAVLDGDWKLVAKADAAWELYDIRADRSELHNLASSQPDRVKSMSAAWDDWAAKSDVLPLGAWDEEQQKPTKQVHFDLKADAHLDRAEAPQIANKPFAITARITTSDLHPDGVLVAQGATALGYALFLKGNQPTFFVRTVEGNFQVTGPTLAPGPHTVTARLTSTGALSLQVDEQPPTTTSGKLMSRVPTDGLDVGRDEVAPVGPYTVPNAFDGAIESVTIDVGTR